MSELCDQLKNAQMKIFALNIYIDIQVRPESKVS